MNNLHKVPYAKVIKIFTVFHKDIDYCCRHRLYKDNIPVTQIIKGEIPYEYKFQIGHLTESEVINVVDLWSLW